MRKPKRELCLHRIDQIPDLPEKIWKEVGSYGHNKWEVPEDRTSLEAIIGQKDTKELYDISDSAEQNIHLRSVLSKPLKSQNHQLRLAAMIWVIYDWGHVRGKSEKHKTWPQEFQNYQPDVIDHFIKNNLKNRIASWSKVLAFADKSKYVIYDARVAMCLNAIFDKLGRYERFIMPPPSSNKLTKLFSDIKIHVRKQYPSKRPTYLNYFDYINLLNAIVEKGLADNILEVEMSLFANGMIAAEEYAQKYNLPY